MSAKQDRNRLHSGRFGQASRPKLRTPSLKATSEVDMMYIQMWPGVSEAIPHPGTINDIFEKRIYPGPQSYDVKLDRHGFADCSQSGTDNPLCVNRGPKWDMCPAPHRSDFGRAATSPGPAARNHQSDLTISKPGHYLGPSTPMWTLPLSNKETKRKKMMHQTPQRVLGSSGHVDNDENPGPCDYRPGTVQRNGTAQFEDVPSWSSPATSERRWGLERNIAKAPLLSTRRTSAFDEGWKGLESPGPGSNDILRLHQLTLPYTKRKFPFQSSTEYLRTRSPTWKIGTRPETVIAGHARRSADKTSPGDYSPQLTYKGAVADLACCSSKFPKPDSFTMGAKCRATSCLPRIDVTQPAPGPGHYEHNTAFDFTVGYKYLIASSALKPKGVTMAPRRTHWDQKDSQRMRVRPIYDYPTSKTACKLRHAGRPLPSSQLFRQHHEASNHKPATDARVPADGNSGPRAADSNMSERQPADEASAPAASAAGPAAGDTQTPAPGARESPPALPAVAGGTAKESTPGQAPDVAGGSPTPPTVAASLQKDGAQGQAPGVAEKSPACPANGAGPERLGAQRQAPGKTAKQPAPLASAEDLPGDNTQRQAPDESTKQPAPPASAVGPAGDNTQGQAPGKTSQQPAPPADAAGPEGDNAQGQVLGETGDSSGPPAVAAGAAGDGAQVRAPGVAESPTAPPALAADPTRDKTPRQVPGVAKTSPAHPPDGANSPGHGAQGPLSDEMDNLPAPPAVAAGAGKDSMEGQAPDVLKSENAPVAGGAGAERGGSQKQAPGEKDGPAVDGVLPGTGPSRNGSTEE